MKEFIEIYEQNQNKIEFFITESIKNVGTLDINKKETCKKLFNIFPSLELIYLVDNETKKQISNNIYRYSSDKREKNSNRSYLLSKINFQDSSIAFSKPYLSSATGNNCITVTIKEDDHTLFFDFGIERLLERLDLIELNKPFHTVTKFFYTAAGFSLAFLSAFIVCYSLFDFFNNFLIQLNFTLDAIFKPIIALTLGIAIFDLAKTILEQEVFFKSYSKNSKVETKIITKFLITIIIALSIEALMVVFKIALHDYDKMINALYLISGISMIIIALSVFIYITKKKSFS